MTWLLIFLNIIFFSIFYSANTTDRASMESILEDEYFYTTQAKIYKAFVKKNAAFYSPIQLKMVSSNIHNKTKARVIASYALSDTKFVKEAFVTEIKGDAIAISTWKQNLKKVLTIQENAPNYQLGLLSNSGFMNLITYQFMHASIGHLISNMIFLLLFGALLENLFGGLLLFITYFASGIVAALVFLYFSMYINSPLIGASGSVSGIIAAYCLANFKNTIRYFYFLYIPKAEYMGFVYLSPWILLMYWLMTDLTGYLSQVTEFSGVAYTAHLGGHFCGAIVALITIFIWKRPLKKIDHKFKPGQMIPLDVFIRRKASSHRVLSDAPRLHKLP